MCYENVKWNHIVFAHVHLNSYEMINSDNIFEAINVAESMTQEQISPLIFYLMYPLIHM